MKTLYMKAGSEDIAKYVIFSGDPGRVKNVCAYLSDVKEIAQNREFYTYTGEYKGMPVTVTSTGIGGPSAAIAMEEMYECGMEVAVRLGTVMGLLDNLGSFIIPKAAMRLESTSATYVEKSYPAVADFHLLSCMNKSAANMNAKYCNGIVCSMDGYYSEMRNSRLSKEMGNDVNLKISSLKKYNIAGIDMETSLILTLANIMNIKACSVVYTTVLEDLKNYLQDDVRKKGEEDLIKLVLEGLFIYHNK